MRPHLLISLSILILNVIACYGGGEDGEENGELELLSREEGQTIDTPIAVGGAIHVGMFYTLKGPSSLEIVSAEPADPEVLGVRIEGGELWLRGLKQGTTSLKVVGEDFDGTRYHNTFTLRVEQTRSILLSASCARGADEATYLSGQLVHFRATRIGDGGRLAGGVIPLEASGVGEPFVIATSELGYITLNTGSAAGEVVITSPDVPSLSHKLRVVSPAQIDELLVVSGAGASQGSSRSAPATIFVQPVADGAKICQPGLSSLLVASKTPLTCNVNATIPNKGQDAELAGPIMLSINHQVVGECSVEIAAPQARDGVGLTRTLVFDEP